uniref:Hpt domain-containing protein n=1 Tax=Thaumasiovibrio occultus TaxID=1891184 RepID=UPI000B35AF66|nr:Hpt domain-containing protein [Thaumasiovibrio occultus]
MIDFSELEMMTGGDDEILNQIIMMYVEEHGQDDVELEKLFQSGDCNKLFHALHTLKGALSSICEKDLVPLLDEMERTARAGSLPSPAQLDAAKQQIQEIGQQLQAKLTCAS